MADEFDALLANEVKGVLLASAAECEARKDDQKLVEFLKRLALYNGFCNGVAARLKSSAGDGGDL